MVITARSAHNNPENMTLNPNTSSNECRHFEQNKVQIQTFSLKPTEPSSQTVTSKRLEESGWKPVYCPRPEKVVIANKKSIKKQVTPSSPFAKRVKFITARIRKIM